MAVNNTRYFLTFILVVCLATPLFASPLFFNIFRKNNSRTATSTTTTASPINFGIDFSLSTNGETQEQSFIERVRSTVRLVTAFVRSFVTVLANRHDRDDSRSLEELATEDTLGDFDPFGVEPSDTEIDFFSTLENPNTVGGASRGRSLDSTAEDSGVPEGDQVVDMTMTDNDAVSSDQNVDSKTQSDDAASSDQTMDPKVEGNEAASGDQIMELNLNNNEAAASDQDMDSKLEANEAASSDQKMELKMDGNEAASSDRNTDSKMGSLASRSSGRSADSGFSSPDVIRAVLLASTRLE